VIWTEYINPQHMRPVLNEATEYSENAKNLVDEGGGRKSDRIKNNGGYTPEAKDTHTVRDSRESPR
jgi:hypothetical protein